MNDRLEMKLKLIRRSFLEQNLYFYLLYFIAFLSLPNRHRGRRLKQSGNSITARSKYLSKYVNHDYSVLLGILVIEFVWACSIIGPYWWNWLDCQDIPRLLIELNVVPGVMFISLCLFLWAWNRIRGRRCPTNQNQKSWPQTIWLKLPGVLVNPSQRLGTINGECSFSEFSVVRLVTHKQFKLERSKPSLPLQFCYSRGCTYNDV